MAPKGACQQCVLPPPPPLSDDLPPFVWPRTAAEIEGLAQGVEIDFTTTMDSVAGIKDEDASVETVLRPLMGAPHYKTNKAVVEANSSSTARRIPLSGRPRTRLGRGSLPSRQRAAPTRESMAASARWRPKIQLRAATRISCSR